MSIDQLISALEKVREQHGGETPIELPGGETLDSISVSALDGHLAVVIWT